VGFRPTVYRCAVSLGLGGFVRNCKSEVVAEIEGENAKVEQFYEELLRILPQAARIDEVEERVINTIGETDFRIVESKSTSYNFPPIPPDLAICDECKRELFNPTNRRYLYPFITCTQCGPRYTIVENTPFDRETTSMIDFPQCDECLEEYTNPLDRRFHSQTNSCSNCGPKLFLTDNRGNHLEGDPIKGAIMALNSGKIVAIQGIGGFHLALNPKFENSVAKLRDDKERERKPFALMVKDIETAEKLVFLGKEDVEKLKSPVSPILILHKRVGIPNELHLVSDTSTLGIFLPYTPLHLLLFLHPEVQIDYKYLIMTSGNRKSEPIITNPEEALEKLKDTADLFLYNNRRILFRTDDSILRRGKITGFFIMRRSRGYVPQLIHIKNSNTEVTLATGSDLKNAPALLKGNDIYLAPYIGDLDNLVAQRDFQNQISKILSLYEVTPDRVVCDMHPLYHSSQWARENFTNLTEVQHHHAHILSVMAEHNLEEVLGLAFDGTGYGTDGNIWGGEFLLCRRDSFKRMGHFMEFPLPGGEAAITHPPRILYPLLLNATSVRETVSLITQNTHITPEELELLSEMITKKINTPITTSLGRLFDAAYAALGLIERVTYEGEAAIKLESLADQYILKNQIELHTIDLKQTEREYTTLVNIIKVSTGFSIDITPLLYHMAKISNIHPETKAALAFLFHSLIARASLSGALLMREQTGINKIALSGGVFQNVILRELLVPLLEKNRFNVYLNRAIPPGDGGIAVGQLYYNGGQTNVFGNTNGNYKNT